jgi:predicted transcriptional regulator
MKMVYEDVFDDKDEEVITRLVDLGMHNHMAMSLLYLSQINECCSADLERGLNLRQPLVSVAMKGLRERGWVEKTEIKKDSGKGRPVHIYKLTMPFTDIVDTLIKDKLSEIEDQKTNIDELRTFITDFTL